MIALSGIRSVFFDFDGVIVDSVDTKIDAFGALYRPFGAHVESAVRDYQRAVPGETRFDKIPRFHRELLGIELSPAEVTQWCDRLSDLVCAQVIAAPLLPDVPDVLRCLQARGIAMHIVSGTPENELRHIVDAKGLAPWFRTVRGSPAKKAGIVREICAADGLSPDECLFIGDAMTDHDCARECATAFLGVATDGTHPFPPGTVVVDRLGEALPTRHLVGNTAPHPMAARYA